jgi:hypothetical protein
MNEMVNSITGAGGGVRDETELHRDREGIINR